jgi:hypothetical protein
MQRCVSRKIRPFKISVTHGEFRLLTNGDMDSHVPFSSLLMGHPTPRSWIKLGTVAARDQRIALRYAMTGMSQTETKLPDPSPQARRPLGPLVAAFATNKTIVDEPQQEQPSLKSRQTPRHRDSTTTTATARPPPRQHDHQGPVATIWRGLFQLNTCSPTTAPPSLTDANDNTCSTCQSRPGRCAPVTARLPSPVSRTRI